MADAPKSPVFTSVGDLRKAIRDNRAGPPECLEFVKTLDIASKSVCELLEVLGTIKSLRDELPFEDAVTFLKIFLDNIDKAFSDANPLFVIEIRLMVAEDLWEQRIYAAAEDEYKMILECVSQHPYPSVQAFALSKLAYIARDVRDESQAVINDCQRADNILLCSKWVDGDTALSWVPYLRQVAMKALLERGAFFYGVSKVHLAGICYSLTTSVASDYDLIEYSHWISTSLYQIDIVNSSGENFSTSFKDEAETILTNFLRSPCKEVDMKILLKSVLRLQISHQWLPKLAEESNWYENIRTMIEEVAVLLILRYELDLNFKTKMDETSCLLLSIPTDDLTSAEDSLVKLREVILHHCSFSKICMLTCYYELAEEHLQKAEELVQLCEEADNRDYAEMRSAIHYAFAVLYYLWRGRMAQTFEHCMLAKKCFRDLQNYRYAALMERVLNHIRIQ